MPAADLIVTGARVLTMDDAQPRAEAVAIVGSRLAYVGSAEGSAEWRGPRTRVVDGRGATLMPGFIDSHFHLLWGSLELADAQLAEADTWEKVADGLRGFGAAAPERPWLVGQGLRYGLRADPPLGRLHLDAVIADRPVLLHAYDHHTAWANTRALELAGILHGGPVGPNSEIVMASDGLATGELREGAVECVAGRIPAMDDVERRQWLRRGLALAAERGLTSVHNMDGDRASLALYAALEDAGDLTLRVYVPFSVRPAMQPDELAEAVALRRDFQGDLVRAGAAKFFMDGVIESYTGLLIDPYADNLGTRGGANFSAEHFSRMAVECDRLGLQIFVHAIGDAAVRRTLDGFEAAARANGPRDSRHRVEHIELIHPDDLPRFQRLGVIASMQPRHAPQAGDGDVWLARVGRDRWPLSFAWRGIRAAGARLVFGSDWPVVTQDPMIGVQAALNRRPWADGQPEQALTLAETLAAYTREAAFAEFQENEKGRLRAGLLADLVLLSADLTQTPASELAGVHPVLTICHGQVVFEK